MKHILQSLKSGKTQVEEVPCPAVQSGHLLIRTTKTLISAGTERMLVEFGKAGWLDKARQQPDKVRMVLDKIKTDGLIPTIEAVNNKLDQPLSMGYCNVGIVEEVGDRVTGFQRGDRVVSNGKHAEVVSVPQNLCVKAPESVSDEEAAFTVVAAIALQGIRLASPTLGECVVVTGLGLIGLITVQLLRANGCRVMGIDYDSKKLERARCFGAEICDLSKGQDPLLIAEAFSRGQGVDAVIVTASTQSNEPIHQAALMCRKRGRIVLVGVTGLDLSRDDFYKKELSFQVSCSYGPGRYESQYEEKGLDYPIGFVRWTEQRNFEAVLDMLAEGRLDVKPLITHRISINEAKHAYEIVSGQEPSLGIVLEYPGFTVTPSVRTLSLKALHLPSKGSKGSVSVIGSGNYANAILIPSFKKAGARLRCVASHSGVSSAYAGRKYGFELTTTDTESVFNDSETDTVVIATRHNSHSNLALKALKAGKHVFVEKPLALTLDELNEIEHFFGRNDGQIHRSVQPLLMIGFNRRFSPLVQKMKSLLDSVNGPKAFVMTVNAGFVPADHWTQDPLVGGGRLVGEACHFIDLLRFLSSSPIANYSTARMEVKTGDTVTISLQFSDGSIGTIHYFANGNKAFPKERIDVFASGRVLQLDNFRGVTGFGWPGFRKMTLWRQDKGQSACSSAFVEAVQKGGYFPIPLEEIVEVSRISIMIQNSLC